MHLWKIRMIWKPELNAKTKEKIEWTKKKKEIHVLIIQIGGGVMILVDIFKVGIWVFHIALKKKKYAGDFFGKKVVFSKVLFGM